MLNVNQIMEILPHRSPFLLVDRIDELEPGKRAVGCKAVTYNEPFFAGHFPQEPVMPGVLICEALAQVGAVALLSCEEHRGKLALFGGSCASGIWVSVRKYPICRNVRALWNCFYRSVAGMHCTHGR